MRLVDTKVREYAQVMLGVQSSDLFQTVDLYEGKDMNQVVSTILTLERVVGGVARLPLKDKRPGPSPVLAAKSSPNQPNGLASIVGVTRMRSKTAHAPTTASTTASIRPSSSAYYAAQVSKLEEDSIRFANGYDRLDAPAFKSKDRHRSSPVPNKSPLLSREMASLRPSLSDIQAGFQSGSQDISFGSEGSEEAGARKEQRDLVFGTSPQSFDRSSPSPLPKSASGSFLSAADGRLSAQEGVGKKKKSISLDPQAANAIMGSPSYRESLVNTGSPGFLIQSASYHALSNMNSSNQLLSLKQHSRYSSTDKDGANRSAVASPASSRSSTPVQGVRKSTISDQTLREMLELWENDSLTATYKLGGFCIGRGQFAAVYKAMNMVTGQMVAVKRIKIDGLKDNEMDLLMQEVDLLKSLEHPSIVKYEGFIKTDGHLNIILEFVENGSLLTTLKSFGTFPEKLVVAYVVKILEGLVYLHGKEVVHCDLKAANILTTKNGNVKLSDFGVSLNLKVKESDFGAVAGTPNWMAPEVIELKGAQPASDIWSLGCTIIEMLTGRPPYAELLAMTTLFRIVEDERPPLPNNLSVDLLDFLCQCFQKDPSLRPTAGALGKHVWIKRNFASRELKPMDSLPYMTRKSLEPREKSLIAAALQGDAKRASTPLGLSSGAPPPAASASALQMNGARGVRRGSVDSASGYYSSSTVPAPTITQEKMHEINRGTKVGNQHQFVKSSFAKPVECRLCHDYVKKQAVICQDCSLVFHRKCQFYVGETCFPGPHLSYFGSPSPAQSVPNLKLLANGGLGTSPLGNGNSRPNSRASQQNDRSRSVTPSQGSSRPCRTPPPASFPKRESTMTNDSRQMASPPPSNAAYRIKSPESYMQHTESPQYNNQSQPPRPPSRQMESPTSPTLSGLRNLISGPRRFSFSSKKSTPQASPTVNTHPLPTPPTSYTSNSALSSQRQMLTPDPGRSSANGHSSTPAAPLLQSKPLPILATKNGSGGRTAHHGREYMPGGPLGPLDAYDDDQPRNNSINNYGRGHSRPNAINLFSTSAPSVPALDYPSSNGSSYDDDDDDDDDDENNIDDIDDMDERDLEALLIPSVVRTPRTSVDAGHPMSGFGRSKGQTISQTLKQKQQQLDDNDEFASLKAYGGSAHGNGAQDIPKKAPPKAPTAIIFGSPPSNRGSYLPHRRSREQPPPSPSRPTVATNGAAGHPMQRTHSNSNSSGSSFGSVAALLEEDERMSRSPAGVTAPFSSSNKHLPALSAYQLATQASGSHHVGIKTMLSRFSTSSPTVASANYSANIASQDTQSNQTSRDASSKASAAYAAAARHQIQAPVSYQQHPSQPPTGARRSIHPFQPSPAEESTFGGTKPEIYPQHLHGYGPGYGQHGQNGHGHGRATPDSGIYSVSSLGSAPSSTSASSFSSPNMSAGGPSSTLAAATNSAASLASSALKRGGKVIRRSIGVSRTDE
ncbi:hypothetical protein BGZ83_001213 [Gryganskiella cystojenkinii]|nr:hypothetical protein BGZ83_001213 [Gryganskiella cystojenkinii]